MGCGASAPAAQAAPAKSRAALPYKYLFKYIIVGDSGKQDTHNINIHI